MSMECNKDEAVRAKEIAERKLSSQDYQGALKFAQKAQQLFPALENMAQMFAVIDVHIAALAKVNGTETDWYGILQVPSQADDLLIKKQYRKLALLLHPDKNKLAGAEAAFKLIGEASQILSDKVKRQVHDAKRVPPAKTSQRSKSSQHRQSHAPQSNGQSYVNRQHPRVPPQNLLPTFWTACPSCHMRFQYLRTYENQNLLCAQCRNPFIARDVYFTQGNGAYSPFGWTPVYQQHQAFNHQPFAPGFNPANNFPAGNKTKTSYSDGMNVGANSTNFPGIGQTKPSTEYVHQEGHTTEYVHQQGHQAVHEKENVEMADPEQKRKRERKDEAQKDKEVEKELRKAEREQQKKAKADLRAQEAMAKLMSKRKEQAEKASAKVKRRRLKKHLSDSSDDEDDEDDSLEDSLSDDQGMDATLESTLHPRRSSRARRNVTYKMDASDDEDPQGEGGVEDDDETASCFPNAKETVKDSGRSVKGTRNGNASVDMKLKEKLADFVKNKIRMNLNLQSGKSTSSTSDVEVQATKAHDNLNDEKGVNARSHLDEPEEHETDKQEESTDDLDEPSDEPEQFCVPDADFHDFDKDREGKDIKLGQIWAAYDEKDGMPRYYCRVKEVQSRSPFKVTISWLELQNLSEEQEELKELDYCCTCGSSFKNSTSQVIDSVNMFSHLVKWEKGPKGMVRIYPREKDVWALYRDWEPDLGFMKGDSPVKYDMVEVLTGFSDLTGVVVAHLDKMSGFKTLFKRTEGSILAIPAAEMSRFSHQVPAHAMQGDEAPGIPKGCWELDPASVPTDLIAPGEDNSNQEQGEGFPAQL